MERDDIDMTLRSNRKSFDNCTGSRILGAFLLLSTLSCGGGEESPSSGDEPTGPAFEVALEPFAPDTITERNLRWSPYGKRLPLVEEDGGLITSLALGPDGTPAMAIRLAKSQGARYFDRLDIDLNRNGTFDTGEGLETTPSETRGRFWSSFSAVVEVPVTDPATGEAIGNPYPLSLWYVEDPYEPEAELLLRFSRRGWMEGRVTLGETDAVVLLTENAMDGVFDRADSWALASADSADDVLLSGYSRPLEEHTWLFEQAYRVHEVDISGRKMILVPFDPGITRTAEEEMNDHLKVDREAARSGKTVAFLHDFSEAEALARTEGKPLFVDFETTWCGPCKIMDEWVYTADQVVDASQGVVAVKVDGDDFPDLKNRFEVVGFPTMILLGPDGAELRRTSGYVNVVRMTDFLDPTGKKKP
jgi:thiol-disulfide isomerase/thioredoxin